MIRRPPSSTLFPTRRSSDLTVPVRAAQVDVGIGALVIAVALEVEAREGAEVQHAAAQPAEIRERPPRRRRLQVLQHVVTDRSEEHTSDSSHSQISYAVFCLK